MSLRSHVLAFTLLALGLSACGGSDGETPTTQGAAAQSTTTTASAAGEVRVVDVSEATITLGGEKYLFKAGTCTPDLLGQGFFRAFLTRVDEGGTPIKLTDSTGNQGVTFGLTHEGSGGAEKSLISIGGDVTWTAHSDTFERSQVDSVSVNGNYASGTATFVSNEGGGPVSGTFEVICAGD